MASDVSDHHGFISSDVGLANSLPLPLPTASQPASFDAADLDDSMAQQTGSISATCVHTNDDNAASIESRGGSSLHSSSDSTLVRPSYRICLVSDFFLPRLGGVEHHQYAIAAALMRRGHKVIVVTGTYDEGVMGSRRQGIRYTTNGLKIYYVPIMSISQQASLPNLFVFFPLFRSILIRERIQLVHGHQSTSALCHEALLHARTMGLATVFTDHSLFQFSNLPAIHLNKLMRFSLADVSRVICVSNCSRENLCLRANLNPHKVHVIPNAIDATKLRPNQNNAPDIHQRFTIVVLSRLVYRKGMDLLVGVIPILAGRYPNLHFLIGGDGPKRVALEEMRERCALHDRVEMIGPVQNDQVREVLTRGHLFLNCSLTEAFCIAILEAVSCGLFVVSTRVGGVPEILPPHLINFAEPNVASIVSALDAAIPRVIEARGRAPSSYPFALHQQVKAMYNWHEVAERTERVYTQALLDAQRMNQRAEEDVEEADRENAKVEGMAAWDRGAPSDVPHSVPPPPIRPSLSFDASHASPSSRESLLLLRVWRYLRCGPFSGILFALVAILDHLFWRCLEWLRPKEEIEFAVDGPTWMEWKEWNQRMEREMQMEIEAERAARADVETAKKALPLDGVDGCDREDGCAPQFEASMAAHL